MHVAPVEKKAVVHIRALRSNADCLNRTMAVSESTFYRFGRAFCA